MSHKVKIVSKDSDGNILEELIGAFSNEDLQKLKKYKENIVRLKKSAYIQNGMNQIHEMRFFHEGEGMNLIANPIKDAVISELLHLICVEKNV